LWLTFLTFFLSLSYPPNYLMIKADEVGWMVI
jgi:hypothetical protein